MADKATTASLNVVTGDSRQHLEEVQAALVATGEAGVASADKITNGLEKIESRSDSAQKKISEGRSISENELNAMAAQYVALEDAAVKAFGSVENAPVELQNALKLAETQIVSVHKSMTDMGDKTKAAADRFRTLGQEGKDGTQLVERGADAAASATKKLGDTGTTAGSTLQRVFANVKDAESGLQEAIESGSPRMATAVSKLVLVHQVLGQEIEKARKSGQAIAPEMESEYDRVGKAIGTQTARVRELTDEMKKHKTEVQDGGEQWNGLTAAVQKAAGGYGNVLATGGLVFAALKEGWAMGSAAAEKMGIDTKSVGQEFEVLGHTAGSALKNITDAGFAKWSGDAEGAAKSMEKAAVAAELLGKNLPHTAAAVDGFNIAIDAGIKVTGDLSTRLDAAAKISAAYTQTQALGREGSKLWTQAVKDSAGSFDGLMVAIDKMQPKIAAYQKAYAEATLVVAAHLKVIDDQIKAQESLIKAHEAEILKIGETVKSIEGEDAARQHLHSTMLAELEDAKKHEPAINGTSASIEDLAKRIEKLSGDYQTNGSFVSDLVARLSSLGKTTIGVSEATQKHIEAVTAAEKVVADLTEKNKQLKASQDELITSGKTQTIEGTKAYETTRLQIAANDWEIAQAERQLVTQAQQLKSAKDLATATDATTESTIRITRASGEAVDAQHKLTGGLDAQTAGMKLATAASAGAAKTASDFNVQSDGTFEALKKAVAGGKSWADALLDLKAKTDAAKDPTTNFKDQVAEIAVQAKKTAESIDIPIAKLVGLQEEYKRAQSTAVESASKMAEAMVKSAGAIEGAAARIAAAMKLVDGATKAAAGGGTSTMYDKPIGPEMP